MLSLTLLGCLIIGCLVSCKSTATSEGDGLSSPPPALDRSAGSARAPMSSAQQVERGVALQNQGNLAAAEEAFRLAVEVDLVGDIACIMQQ